jgi:FKBP-type peptidyl-prolyl cis-trans isomerase
MPQKLFLYFFISLLLLACVEKNNSHISKKKSAKELKKPLLKANRGLVSKEIEEIEAYINRRNWQMQKSGSGLRYMIVKQGSGKPASAGMYAHIRYSISLLDGTQCYSTKDKPERFLIDHDNVESGLHEGIKLLVEGDKAIFILPPHLAHGLIGDQAKIPPLSTIVYDLELVAVK